MPTKSPVSQLSFTVFGVILLIGGIPAGVIAGLAARTSDAASFGLGERGPFVWEALAALATPICVSGAIFISTGAIMNQIASR